MARAARQTAAVLPDGARLGAPAAHPTTAGALATLPNAITLARLCAVPLAVWLVVRHHTGWAFFLFVAAGVSDAVDGWLARRLGPTHVGALLDPVADKLLLASMYVTLAIVGLLPDWLAILVVFRDVLIVGGVLAQSVLGHPLRIRPLWVSKVNTALQILLVAAVLMMAGFDVMSPGLTSALVWIVTTSTLLSGAAYVRQAARA